MKPGDRDHNLEVIRTVFASGHRTLDRVHYGPICFNLFSKGNNHDTAFSSQLPRPGRPCIFPYNRSFLLPILERPAEGLSSSPTVLLPVYVHHQCGPKYTHKSQVSSFVSRGRLVSEIAMHKDSRDNRPRRRSGFDLNPLVRSLAISSQMAPTALVKSRYTQ